MKNLSLVIVLFLIASLTAGCADTPKAKPDYQGQRDRAEKAQGELSTATRK